MSAKIEMTLATKDLNSYLDRLSVHLQKEVMTATCGAMSNVIYQEVRTRVPVGHPRYEKKLGKKRPGGLLKSAIYQAHSPEKSTTDSVVYMISWNGSKAKHGHLIEYGHWLTSLWGNKLKHPVWIPPKPFLRPAMSAFGRAIEAGKDRFYKKMDEFT